MDISRVPNGKKLHLCKVYFIVGWFLLPFVWTINVFWFFNDAFCKPTFEEQKTIKRFVVASAVGSIAWLVAIVTWVTTFQLNRAEWGEFADSISFIIPLGRA